MNYTPKKNRLCRLRVNIFVITSLVYPISRLKYSKDDLNLNYIDFVVELHNYYFYNEENETTLGESF